MGTLLADECRVKTDACHRNSRHRDRTRVCSIGSRAQQLSTKNMLCALNCSSFGAYQGSTAQHALCPPEPCSSLMLVPDLLPTVDPYSPWIPYLWSYPLTKICNPQIKCSCTCRVAHTHTQKYRVPAEVKEDQTALLHLPTVNKNPLHSRLLLHFLAFFFFISASDFHLKWSSGVVLK